MTQHRSAEFAPVTGVEFKPAVGKLWGMLLFFTLMILAGAVAAYCWWYEVELFAGRVLSAKAGIVGLLAIPLGLFLVLVTAVFLTSAKRLVIGEKCLQMLSKGDVVVHIPYENVADTYARGEGSAGVVGLKLRDRDDPATLVPSRTKDRYEIQVLIYGKPLQHVHQVLAERLAAFRSGVK
jgi:hypothetical protein